MYIFVTGVYNVTSGNIRKLPPQVDPNNIIDFPRGKGQNHGNHRTHSNNYEVHPGTSQTKGYHTAMVDPRTKNKKRTSSMSQGQNGAQNVYGSHSNIPPRSQGPLQRQNQEHSYHGNQNQEPTYHANKGQFIPNLELSHHSHSKQPNFQTKTDGCYGNRQQQPAPDNTRWDNTNDLYGDNGSSTSGSYILDSKDMAVDGSDNPKFKSVVV